MKRTIICTCGWSWIGFGRRDGLFTEYRCGFFAIGWCRGDLREQVAEMLADRYRASNEAMEALMRRVTEALKGGREP